MAAPAIVTSDELSEYTQGKVLAADPRVQPLLDGATAAVRRYCGWHIAPSVTETFTLDGPGGRLLALPTLHLTAVTGVAESGTALAEYDAVTGEGDFEWSTNGEIRRLGGYWTERFRALSVAVTHGYDTAPDVAQIIKQVVSAALSSPMGATREQVGPFAVSWATTAPGTSGGLSLLQRDFDVLSAYRIVSA